ncbi:ABC transporter ATP-binding protein [Amycolatopsis jejuensis]|uniref:ABC transporter ATP-binding protein n=1 Tax=Amycolatopsis jejuensis TaxID=330084 RepID=UPI000527EDE8|nr:ABC transporter ATP-binding protein [Amycolatopsis jejuensis]
MTGHCVLDLEDLSVGCGRAMDPVLVEGVSLRVHAGECLGLVGESGSGKSLTLRSLLGLLPATLHQRTGQLRFSDVDGALHAREPRTLRGDGVSMVFQEPMSSLNPTMRVGDLVAAGARVRGLSAKEAARRAVDLLGEVGVPEPRQRMRAWPHELSGGLRQRVMIAMALSVEPRLLLCDEPTTALDVTIQDQILSLIERLQRDRGLAVVFVSHNLAVISRIADRTAVMYAGRIVEQGPTQELVTHPRHPYTRALIDSMPRAHVAQVRLSAIPGSPPTAGQLAPGCRFAPRCSMADDACAAVDPPLAAVHEGHDSACLHHSLLVKGTVG